ncbi:MAG: RNA polymerase sigma factor [Polyangiaceae bacterium]
MVREISEAVFAGLQRGDAAAFDAVYDCYRARVFAFLVRLTKHRALAEDLTQETFLRLARSAPELRTDTNLRAWLFRVARNLVVDHQRWALLDFDRLFELSLWPRPVSQAAATPLDLVEASETQRRLEDALADLATEHREVVLLVLVEGMEPAEAAEVLGISAVALRKRLSRARERLAAELAVERSYLPQGEPA